MKINVTSSPQIKFSQAEETAVYWNVKMIFFLFLVSYKVQNFCNVSAQIFYAFEYIVCSTGGLVRQQSYIILYEKLSTKKLYR
jgi:hypothetical protein